MAVSTIVSTAVSGISQTVAVVGISLSLRLGISGPLAVSEVATVETVSVSVSKTVCGVAQSVSVSSIAGISQTVSIDSSDVVGIGSSLSLRLGLSGPLAVSEVATVSQTVSVSVSGISEPVSKPVSVCGVTQTVASVSVVGISSSLGLGLGNSLSNGNSGHAGKNNEIKPSVVCSTKVIVCVVYCP